MDIQLLHTPDCHIWEKTLEVLNQVLKEAGIKDQVKQVIINTQEEAETNKFLGSPAIFINGVDVDPRARNLTNYTNASCRSYVYNNNFFEYPPREMILDALQKK